MFNKCETYRGIERQVIDVFNRHSIQFRKKYRFIKSERKSGRIIEIPIYTDIFWECAEGSEIENYFHSLDHFGTYGVFNDIVNGILNRLCEERFK